MWLSRLNVWMMTAHAQRGGQEKKGWMVCLRSALIGLYKAAFLWIKLFVDASSEPAETD